MEINVFFLSYVAGSIYLTYRGLLYIFETKRAIKFFVNNSINLSRSTTSLAKLVCLIPLLREQGQVENLLAHFSTMAIKDKTQVWLITTNKEQFEMKQFRNRLSTFYTDLVKKTSLDMVIEAYRGVFTLEQIRFLFKKFTEDEFDLNYLINYYDHLLSTYEVALKLVKKHNSKLKFEYFIIMNYPKTNGVMADQLNYAIKKISKTKFKDTFISLYNADSRPNLRSFKAFLNQITSSTQVSQQVAVFIDNYSKYRKTFSGYLLKASAIIQTRWSLGFEFPMLLAQSNYWLLNKNKHLSLIEKVFEPITYCVGHGLFIRLDTLNEIGGFPSETLNEDLPLGYYLSLKKTPVQPFPLLESADNPYTVSSLIKQKSSWFWGMSEYFLCRRLVSSKIGTVDSIRVNATTIKSLLRDAVPWLVFSPLLFLYIIYNFTHPILIPLGLLTLLIYVVVPTFYIANKLPILRKLTLRPHQNESSMEKYLLPLFSILYLLISNVGPWLTVLNMLSNKLFHSPRVKYKTNH